MEFSTIPHPSIKGAKFIVAYDSKTKEFVPNQKGCLINPDYSYYNDEPEYILLSQIGTFEGTMEKHIFNGIYHFKRDGRTFKFEGTTERLALRDGKLIDGEIEYQIGNSKIKSIKCPKFTIEYTEIDGAEEIPYWTFATNPGEAIKQMKFAIIKSKTGSGMLDQVPKITWLTDEYIYEGEFTITKDLVIKPVNRGKFTELKTCNTFHWVEAANEPKWIPIIEKMVKDNN